MLCGAWLEAIGKQRIELTIGSFTVAVNGPRWCARTVAAFAFMAATPVQLARANHLVTLATYRPPWPTPESAGAPELRHLGMRDMLQNATFSGFFAIDKDSILGINP